MSKAGLHWSPACKSSELDDLEKVSKKEGPPAQATQKNEKQTNKTSHKKTPPNLFLTYKQAILYTHKFIHFHNLLS